MNITRLQLLLFCLLFEITSNIIAQPLTQNWASHQPNAFPKLITNDLYGNIIVVATKRYNQSGARVIIYKYSKTGQLLWTRLIMPTASSLSGCQIRPHGVEIDTLNNIYIGGSSNLSCNSNDTPEGFLVKYDSLGNLVWDKRLGANDGYWIEFNAMKMFHNRIYVSGFSFTLGLASNFQNYVACYDTSGSKIWSNTLNNTYDTKSLVMDIDKHGFIYCSGTTNCCISGSQVYICKYDTSGVQQWCTPILDATTSWSYPTKIALDDSSNVFLGGTGTRPVFNGFEFIALKVDSSGNKRWYKIYTDTSIAQGNSSDDMYSIAIDSLGNSYFCGFASDNASHGNGLITKIKPNGIFEWQDIYNGPGNSDDGFFDGFIFKQSSYMVAGSCAFSTSLNGTAFRNYSFNGNVNWTIQLPNYSSIEKFLYLDSSFFCIGIFYGSLQGGNDSLQVARWDESLSNFVLDIDKSKLFISPNPTNGKFLLLYKEQNNQKNKLCIYEIGGIKKYEFHDVAFPFSIDMTEDLPGLYVLELVQGKTLTRAKLIKY